MSIEDTTENNPANRNETRNSDGTFKPGISGNPNGRPTDTLKAFIARKFREMDDEQKQAWIDANKISAIDIWRMAEGNPKQDVDMDATITGPSIVRLDE